MIWLPYIITTSTFYWEPEVTKLIFNDVATRIFSHVRSEGMIVVTTCGALAMTSNQMFPAGRLCVCILLIVSYQLPLPSSAVLTSLVALKALSLLFLAEGPAISRVPPTPLLINSALVMTGMLYFFGIVSLNLSILSKY